MANKHPYVNAPGSLVQAIGQFRRSFPAIVNADTLKKLSIAPNNESYVLNVLRHIALIDDEGKKTPTAAKIFNLHDDASFNQEFGALIRAAYSELFALHDESTWTLDPAKLIAFFRNHDQTTAIVGQRQATTFQLLAAYAGHGTIPEVRGAAKKPASKEQSGSSHKAKPRAAAKIDQTPAPPLPQAPPHTTAGVGLTVRIEINLPAGGDQDTYDRIFRSIRENLLRKV